MVDVSIHGVDSGYARGCRCDDCRAAHAEYMRAYYAANPGPIRERNRRWRAANRDKVAALDRAKVKANPETYRRIAKRYKHANREKGNAYLRAWAKANPEKRRAKEERRRGRHSAALVPGAPVTSDGLSLRLAMFVGCWMVEAPRPKWIMSSHSPLVASISCPTFAPRVSPAIPARVTSGPLPDTRSRSSHGRRYPNQ